MAILCLGRKQLYIYSKLFVDYTCDVQRGTWFSDHSGSPIAEKFADQIEKEHLVKFKGQQIDENPSSDKTKGHKSILTF